MTHHDTRLPHDVLEKDFCKLLCLYELFITETVDCFPIATEEIVFLLAPQIVEAEQKLELKQEMSHSLRADFNDTNSNTWCYKEVEGINLIHYRDRIYIPKTLRKHVLKWYHQYLQHPGGKRLAATLTTICRWSGILNQARQLCGTCKACQKYKT